MSSKVADDNHDDMTYLLRAAEDAAHPLASALAAWKFARNGFCQRNAKTAAHRFDEVRDVERRALEALRRREANPTMDLHTEALAALDACVAAYKEPKQ